MDESILQKRLGDTKIFYKILRVTSAKKVKKLCYSWLNAIVNIIFTNSIRIKTKLPKQIFLSYSAMVPKDMKFLWINK